MVTDTPNDPNLGQVVTPGVDVTALYTRHEGPYSLVQTRLVKGDQVMGLTRGPMIARQAHDESVALVTGPGDVIHVYVYSEKEKQFIGAIYERGKVYAPWNKELGPHGYGNAGMESAVDQPVEDPTLLPRRQCPVRPEGNPNPLDASPGEPLSGTAPVRAVRDGARNSRVPKAARVAGDRFPAVRGRALELDAGNAERWPTSKGPACVRAWFEAEPGRQATVAEITAALGHELIAMGVGFPASLVSRLKQAGFLREASHGSTPTD